MLQIIMKWMEQKKYRLFKYFYFHLLYVIFYSDLNLVLSKVGYLSSSINKFDDARNVFDQILKYHINNSLGKYLASKYLLNMCLC